MRTILFATVALFVLAASAVDVDKEGDVLVLKDKNFDEWIKDQPIALVEFYAPWCGHCKKLAPEYEKAATILKDYDPPVPLAKVDCTEEKETAEKYEVHGYPTLKVFRNGNPTEYKGTREVNGIVSYMKKQAAPALKKLTTSEELEKYIADEAAVVFFGSSGTLFDTFKALADKERETYRFAYTDSSEVQGKYNHKDEIVVMQAKKYSQSPLEVAEVLYSGSPSKSGELLTFIKENWLPRAGHIHNDNNALYSARNLPILKLYVDVDWAGNAKGVNYYLNRLRKVAKDYSRVLFAVSDFKASSSETQTFGFTAPGAVALWEGSQKFKGPDNFTPEAVKTFLDDYMAGKLESFIKSEPIPTNNGDVTVVVGKNFESVVLDPTKDVLLEIYAPWCGHCKQLEPKYNELAKKMKQYSNSLVIAKVDGTANDVPKPFTANGFPTIYFAPANNKGAPITYSGGREVADFEKFIKEKASLPLVAAKTEL